MDEPDQISNHFPTSDSLTGALSRHAFLEASVSEFRKFQRYQHHFALLIADIDHFAEFNQCYSCEVGDQVLQQLVASFLQTLREQDLVGRLGGDEFGILLLENDTDNAQKTAQRLQQNWAALGFKPTQDSAYLTISIGISTPQEEDRSFEQVFLRADHALGIAKQNGGNRVEIEI